jgi:hypothetical protein
MWGPLVLAGDLGPARERRRRDENTSVSEPTAFAPPPPAPALVMAQKPVNQWLKPAANSPGTFRTDGVRLKEEINFTPFYRLPRRRYAIYWDKLTPSEAEKKAAALPRKRNRKNWRRLRSPPCNPGGRNPRNRSTSKAKKHHRCASKAASAAALASGSPMMCRWIPRRP